MQHRVISELTIRRIRADARVGKPPSARCLEARSSRADARVGEESLNPPRRHAGFTLMETIVLIGLLIILLSIFIPYISSIRESNRRINCVNNLSQIRDALSSYARDNGGEFPRVVYDAKKKPDGYTCFTGPDDANPFAPGSSVQANDVTASLWLLVHIGYIADTKVFICPSSNDTRDPLLDASGDPTRASLRSNFRMPNYLSYSYASPFSSAPGYRLNDTKRAQFALMADKNPGEAATKYPPNAPPRDLAHANSPNHGHAGQNVLFADSTVLWVRTPFCGVGYGERAGVPGDNIFTAQAAIPATQPTTIPGGVRGFVGVQYSAAGNDDSYLVPTADDIPTPPVLLPATVPATGPTTTAPTTAPPASMPAPTTSTTLTTTAPARPAPERVPPRQPATTSPRTAPAATTIATQPLPAPVTLGSATAASQPASRPASTSQPATSLPTASRPATSRPEF